MPNKASAKKALRQSKKRAIRNKIRLARIRDLRRHFRKSIEAKDREKAESLIKDLIVELDKAAQKKIIKLNTAARKKSRLMKKFNEFIKSLDSTK